jgi:hypothetical protein
MMAVVWATFWVCITVWFEDPTVHHIPHSTASTDASLPINPQRVQMVTIFVNTAPTSEHSPMLRNEMTLPQWGVSFTMCWFAMTCFFILGAWEANLPVFGAPGAGPFMWSPFAAGNFIALGGITAFPFLLMNGE